MLLSAAGGLLDGIVSALAPITLPGRDALWRGAASTVVGGPSDFCFLTGQEFWYQAVLRRAVALI